MFYTFTQTPNPSRGGAVKLHGIAILLLILCACVYDGAGKVKGSELQPSLPTNLSPVIKGTSDMTDEYYDNQPVDFNTNPDVIIENSVIERGFTSVPHYVFSLPVGSNAKLVYIILLKYAWDAGSCFPGLEKMCKDISMSRNPVINAIKELTAAGIIEVKRRGLGKTNLYILKDHQKFRNETSGSSQSEHAEVQKPNRKKSSNETSHIRKNKTQVNNTHAQERGRVASRFSIEEYERYAATRKGIENPSGWAVYAKRSGEFDDQVSAFLNPSSIADCLRCKGTGVVYADAGNPDKGMRKCQHEVS